MRSRLTTIALIGVLAVQSGCHDVIGPESITTTKITGRVRIGNKPLTKGWIEFAPYDGTLGRLRSAEIGPDGAFSIEKVPVGSVRIHLAGPRQDPTGDSITDWYLVQLRRGYPTRVEIKPGPNAVLDIDLQSEAIALEKNDREKRRGFGVGGG